MWKKEERRSHDLSEPRPHFVDSSVVHGVNITSGQ